MTVMRFLCDEHVHVGLINAVKKLDNAISIVAVGRSDAPVKGTLDPELLAWAETNQHAILTLDESSFPRHIDDHKAVGRHTWGVFKLREGFSLGSIADEIFLLWTASEAEEWRDLFVYIPFSKP